MKIQTQTKMIALASLICNYRAVTTYGLHFLTKLCVMVEYKLCNARFKVGFIGSLDTKIANKLKNEMQITIED